MKLPVKTTVFVTPATLTICLNSDSLFWPKEVIYLTEEKIITVVEANIGREDREGGENTIRDAAYDIATHTLIIGTSGVSKASLILNMVKAPFKDTKVYVKTYVMGGFPKEDEIENIRKSFAKIPWCVKSEIVTLPDKNLIQIIK